MVVRLPGCRMRLRQRWFSRAVGGLLEGTVAIAILSLAKRILRKWRNWQTRQVEGLVSFLDVEVRVLFPALVKKQSGESSGIFP